MTDVRTEPVARTRGAIDADVHPYFSAGVGELAPYLGEDWSLHLSAGRPESKGTSTSAFSMPATHYTNLGGSNRLDAVTPGGGPPASDPEHARKELLERYDLGAAVLLGGDMLGLGGMADADWATAIARGYNDWMADVWLSADERWKAAVVVAPQDPLQAAREVERWGAHPGMLSVFVPNGEVLLGKRALYPIYEVAEHYRMPICVHPGGSGAGVNTTLLPVQHASYYAEFQVAQATIFMAHLCSLIFEGVFERFPDLQVGLIEAGFAWMPHFLWRLDSNWKGLRAETPWVKRLPSEYIREHVRLTSQPMYEPPKRSHLLATFEMMHAEEILMFSTDYPHWDSDAPDTALRRVPDDLLGRMTHDTPRAFFKKLSDQEVQR